jgi:hypothetical protein
LTLYACDELQDFSTQSLDFQLTIVNGIARREREKPAYNRDTTRAKLE